MLAERLRRLPHMVNFSLQYRTAALRAERRLAQLARGQGPIIAGPFRSEIGFEVLYWIPLLRWFVERYDIEPDRVLAVSRGGPASWYRDVAGAYADVFDHYTPGDLRRWLDEQVAATGSQKQKALSAPEREVLARIARERGLEGPAVLPPSVMYNLFWAYNAGYRPIEDVAARTR